jgi:ribosomal protein S18 acetylase RimI-like enzyme
LDLSAVENNIVMFRESNSNSLFGAGFTLVFFMDSEQSANDMRDGKLPYLMVPRGAFHSGGSPITDIWKKKYQRPGTEHILGIFEGYTNEEEIYIDMLTVRPKFQKNTIAKKIVDAVRKRFPNAKIYHSSPTDAGSKFNKSYKKNVPADKWVGEK